LTWRGKTKRSPPEFAVRLKKARDGHRRVSAYNAVLEDPASVGEGVSVIELLPTTEQLLADWRDAQHALETIRLDAPGRAEAEDRVHDARRAYQIRMAELEEEGLSVTA
jgi:hypothetical protein